LTCTETPATEIVAVSAPPEFAATTSVTLPGPVPLELPETVIQDGRFVTDHAQDEPVCMVNVKSPPEAVADKVSGLTEAEQEAAEGVRIRTRLFPLSATYTLPTESTATPAG
jgi:hypothetical protein